MADALTVSFAPEKLWQNINPWTFNQNGAQFGLVNINLGQTPHPEIERAILDEVGSYGRQLGRISDALEVLLKHVDLEGLPPEDRDVLDVARGQFAAVRQVKRDSSHGGNPSQS